MEFDKEQVQKLFDISVVAYKVIRILGDGKKFNDLPPVLQELDYVLDETDPDLWREICNVPHNKSFVPNCYHRDD